MTTSVDVVGGRSLMQVEGEFTIFQASELKPELLNGLRTNDQPEVEVDLSRVSEIDTSGVQLMLMLKREAQTLGKTLTFTHHSPSVLAVIDLLNLGGVLGDPLLLTARESAHGA